MNPTAPFAGTTVPAKGVSRFVASILATETLEDGLRTLHDAVVGDRAIEAGVWVWPEPGMTAIGLVGVTRLYEVRRHVLADGPPSEHLLNEWSAPRHLQTRRNEHQFTWTLLGESGAIGLPHALPRLSSNEQQWYRTWLHWLALRETALRDAKLRSLAEFAAGAGHEINNPLGTILGRSQLLQRQESDPDRLRGLTTIANQALRIRDMIADTMSFARPPLPKCQTIDLAPVIHEVLLRFQPELLTTASIALNKQWAPELFANVDRDQFQVALLELLRNAMHAVGTGGKIGLRARPRHWADRDWIEVDLFNNGLELTPAEREHLFDPFFSGRNAGRGLGFGLTKCWRIVQAHGGHIGVDSNPDRTVFRSLWPAGR